MHTQGVTYPPPVPYSLSQLLALSPAWALHVPLHVYWPAGPLELHPSLFFLDVAFTQTFLGLSYSYHSEK